MLVYTVHFLNLNNWTDKHTVGDGNTQDPLVEKQYEIFSLQQMPVLRLARFSYLSGYKKWFEIVLLFDL